MIDVSILLPRKLTNFIGALGSAGRHNLFSAAAAAVCDLTRRHISREAMFRHKTARALNASATGFLSAAARKTVFHASSEMGEVVIPSPGFSRARHDVTIRPTRAAALTLPLHQLAYARRVSELKALGWNIFRPKGHDVLMGEKDGETTCLYLLKKRVEQKQDRTLLPSDQDILTTASRAMLSEITRAVRKAS